MKSGGPARGQEGRLLRTQSKDVTLKSLRQDMRIKGRAGLEVGKFESDFWQFFFLHFRHTFLPRAIHEDMLRGTPLTFSR